MARLRLVPIQVREERKRLTLGPFAAGLSEADDPDHLRPEYDCVALAPVVDAPIEARRPGAEPAAAASVEAPDCAEEAEGAEDAEGAAAEEVPDGKDGADGVEGVGDTDVVVGVGSFGAGGTVVVGSFGTVVGTVVVGSFGTVVGAVVVGSLGTVVGTVVVGSLGTVVGTVVGRGSVGTGTLVVGSSWLGSAARACWARYPTPRRVMSAAARRIPS